MFFPLQVKIFLSKYSSSSKPNFKILELVEDIYIQFRGTERIPQIGEGKPPQIKREVLK